MTLKEAARRAFITFIAGATASPLTAAVLDIEVWKAAAAAGIVAVWNYAGRVAQALRAQFDGDSILVEWDDLSPWVDPNREN